MSDEPLVASSTVEEQAPPPEKLTGISVYPGIAYGLCQQFSAGDLEIPQFVIEKTGTRGEIQRLRAAIATVPAPMCLMRAWAQHRYAISPPTILMRMAA
jgi:phosphoenolpyruvate-protein kinase (PTS system EI component)